MRAGPEKGTARRRRTSIEGRQFMLLMVSAGVAASVFGALALWPRLAFDPILALLAAVLVVIPFNLWLARASVAPLARTLRAVETAVASYRDGDFSISIALDRSDELGDLIAMHNALGETLRRERQNLVERELLLDSVVEMTPVALVLVDAGEHVVYANLAARHMLNDGRALAGIGFGALLETCPEALRDALANGEDVLFSMELEGSEETFHVSRREFRLHGRLHRLHLVRRMTRELSRREVAIWKKLIRVLSHELNNSMAPLSSLAHSGAELARRGDLERLPAVFAGIGERVRHLHGFLDGYARFARLPAPRREPVAWRGFFDDLGQHASFRIAGDVPAAGAAFDRAQIEQLLLNLIKNAHEAGGAAAEVEVSLRRGAGAWRIEVADHGPGMSEAVLAQALLPFYSTKRAGTGLGLALAREIIEAHGGQIMLANRTGGGLRVSLVLPDASGI